MGRTYLYGIIWGVEETAFGIPGVDGASPVRIMTGDGLGCVVSDYIAEDLGALAKEELVKRLLGHQHVVERVMQEYTVLPVKFGTTVNTPDDVQLLLAQGHRQLAGALASIQDKVEVEVAATWDLKQVLQEVAREEEVAQARDSLARLGQPTLEQRVLLGQVVKTSLDRRRDAYRERVVDFLSPLSVDMGYNALVSDEMVLNVAFLVQRDQQREFVAAVEQLDDLLQKHITFRVIGPLPPYSFSTVEITPLTAEQVARAQQALHVEENASEAQVRRAYRRLAAEEQRNRKSGDRTASKESAGLKQASELLLHYLQARKDRRPGPADRDTRGAFLVSIKGPINDGVEPARFGGAAKV